MSITLLLKGLNRALGRIIKSLTKFAYLVCLKLVFTHLNSFVLLVSLQALGLLQRSKIGILKIL